MGITQLVTGLAVAAAGCVGVNAMQLDFGMDVLRDKISSMSAACDVETSHGALQTVADNVRDGYDTWSSTRPRQLQARRNRACHTRWLFLGTASPGFASSV